MNNEVKKTKQENLKTQINAIEDKIDESFKVNGGRYDIENNLLFPFPEDFDLYETKVNSLKIELNQLIEDKNNFSFYLNEHVNNLPVNEVNLDHNDMLISLSEKELMLLDENHQSLVDADFFDGPNCNDQNEDQQEMITTRV